MPSKLRDLIVEHIWLINDKMERDVVADLQNEGVTLEQLKFILALNRSDNKQFSVGDTQRVLHVSQPTATGIVNRLEKSGFVKSKRGEDDKRVKLIELTKKGKKCIDKADSALDDMEKTFEEIISAKEKEELTKILEKIYKSVK